MQRQYTRFLLLVLSLCIAIADQVSKYYVNKHLQLFASKPFLSFWNWTLVYNQGAAFSFLANQGGWQKIFFGLVAFLVSIALVFYLLHRRYAKTTGVALSFILGGALGNLVDRIVHGRVTDFIDWYYATYHWPAFNIADSFITMGVILLVFENVFCVRR